MRLAETVTFGGAGPGGGFDRAAVERGTAVSLAAEPGAGVVLFWRGKPLIAGDALARLTPGHPVVQGSSSDWVFLGRADGAPVFAAELAGWAPDGVDPAALDSFSDTTRQAHPALPADHAFAELRAVMTLLSPREAELAATARALFNWHRSHRFCAACGQPSEIAQAGWQRVCPACKAHHFPRTDPVVIMLITHGNSLLLGRAPAWPEGMYSLLAGFVEPGETMEAAVRREVAEETQVRVGRVDYLASQPWPFPSSLMLGCHGHATSRDITVDPVEIEDARWLTREDLAQAFAGEHPVVKPARRGAIARFLMENWLADRLD